MKILALSTASPALSLALFDDGVLTAHRHDIIGRGHAEALMPAIATLMGDGRADAIIVDIGPGSFTGIRIGIAAARALGLAWGVPVTGCTGAALVAVRAFAEAPGLAAVTVLLDAGRGQVLRQAIDANFDAGAIATVTPDEAAAAAGATAGAMAPATAIHHGQPDMAFALYLPAHARDVAPQALYVRPPDAVLPL
ncbi:tRNA (adenosine(37)-N6)-threonylcarbamoyltransferase complex dimerization subunit type 1 TsaB [Sandarakinorhabdus sp. DWP1-3-1]|uniref:tRNA (adenosine(37)-N6)-threonylcarbamoyltransferase complex dimerization subunit type 1 TsaB n=1 Tax=Sandarakinorhabdus sp. DWP1-3-1 TaxID=2804627 RepID=UPI003CE944EA